MNRKKPQSDLQGGEELVDHAAEEDGEDGEADAVDDSREDADHQQQDVPLGGEVVLQQCEILYEQSSRRGEAGGPATPEELV